MKFIRNILTVGLILTLFVFPSCDEGTEGPSEEEQLTELLSAGTWKVSNVIVDGVSKKEMFTDLTIKFTKSDFTTTNGGPLWPASGSWSLVDATAKTIKRNDDVSITIETLTDNELVLSLNWTKTTLGKGRVESVAGKHVFSFTK